MTESIDFQNGFVCGMATKGLIKTGAMYEPTCWNDEGVYGYFYIDFHRALSSFSLGMLTQSIILHDSVQITIEDYDYVSPGVYKIYVDLSGKVKGVTVINKETGILYFSNGSKVPAFSIMFFVSGLDRYERLHYIYESEDIESMLSPSSVSDTLTFLCPEPLRPVEILEDVTNAGSTYLLFSSTVVEGVSVVLT